MLKYWNRLQLPELKTGAGSLAQWASSALNRRAREDTAGNVTITRRQVYILPTGHGLIFAVMLVGMLIGSNNYGVNAGFMLTFLLAGAGLAAMFETWRNLVELRFTPARPRPVFQGEVAEFPFYVSNPSRRPRSGLQLYAQGQPAVFDLAPGRQLQVTCTVQAKRRGVLHPGRWTVRGDFPLGLFRAWAHFTSRHKCLVYPKPAAPGTLPEQLTATAGGKPAERDDNPDFSGHRKYRAGDNPRRLDWKALARGRGRLVRQYRGEGPPEETWLDWDQVPGNDVEMRLSILCRAVLDLSERGAAYGLRLPGAQLSPGRGEQHRTDCLTALALF